jgi:hypothetical protein
LDEHAGGSTKLTDALDVKWIPESDPNAYWFAVRLVVLHGDSHYEETITIWNSPDAETAMDRARRKGEDVASTVGGRILPFAQSFRLAHFPGDGAEVFSLIRESSLTADRYLETFFWTGHENEDFIDS